jgi:queuine tRNA-ribosyltransferase
MDPDCSCYACQNFSRAYIRHLLNADEILGLRLTTYHNIHFYLKLVREARRQILAGNFADWKKEQIEKWKININE